MFKNKNDYNTLKIADFGFSTVCEDDRETRDCGTLIYKSPEQIIGKFYDNYIDLWATGYILYILCSGGAHPIFTSGMGYEQYVENFKSLKEWKFTPEFPMCVNIFLFESLARNLFLKICKRNKMYRYESAKCLLHPWISRDFTSNIPLTLMETYVKSDLEKKFKNVINLTQKLIKFLSISVFLALYRKKNYKEFEKINVINKKSSTKETIYLEDSEHKLSNSKKSDKTEKIYHPNIKIGISPVTIERNKAVSPAKVKNKSIIIPFNLAGSMVINSNISRDLRNNNKSPTILFRQTNNFVYTNLQNKENNHVNPSPSRKRN